MGCSIYFLVATMVSGDMPPAVSAGAVASQPVATTSCDACAPACCEQKDGLFSRLKGLRERLHGLFGGKACCCCECCCGACSESGCPPMAGAAAQVVVDTLPLPPVSAAAAPLRTTSNPSEIKQAYLPKLNHADDYSSVTGQLYYIHADGGLWVVRYAPVDREDRFGGSVVLAEATNMSNFREGDLVTVSGEILNEGRASKWLGGPLYRTTGAELIERSGD
jgi:hypothetical protein